MFWETALYKKHHEGEVHPDMIKTYTFQGKDLQGIFAEDDGRPLPTGAIRLSDFDTAAVQQSAEVENASECFREGQGDDTMRHLQSMASHGQTPSAASSVVSKSTSGKSKMTATLSRRSRKVSSRYFGPRRSGSY